MNFGISTMPLEDYQLQSKLTLLKEAGIEYLEVKPKEGHFNYYDPKYLDEMSKEFKGNGIKVISMHMPTHGADISMIEEYDRVWSVREVEKTALALLRLGGEILVVHPGSEIKDEKTRKARREKSKQSLEEILKFCEQWGIKIALENTLPGKTGDSIPEILEIVKKFDSKNLGICLDTGPVSYTHLRAHETVLDLVCRLLLEKK